jgi:hypothetical protein
VAISALPVSRRLGNGVVLRDVIDVMSIHDRSMSGAEVHATVEPQFGHPVSRESVNRLPFDQCAVFGAEVPAYRPSSLRDHELRPAEGRLPDGTAACRTG